MLSRLKTSTLTSIAGIGGLGIGVLVLLIGRERDANLSKSGFMKTAHDFVRSQPVVTDLLGASFELGKAKINDGWTQISGDHVQVRVPVKGDKDVGALYVYARREESKSKYKLVKLEMTFDKVKNKKLLLLDRDNENTPAVDQSQTTPQDVDKSTKV